MKEFFNKAKQLIQNLIDIRYKQSELFIKLEKKKDSTSTLFKIKSYIKWLSILDIQIKNNIEIKTINDIKLLNLSEKLEIKLCELFDCGEIKDLEEAKQTITILETQLKYNENGNTNSLSNSIVSIDSSIDDSEEIINHENENEYKNSTSKKNVIVEPTNTNTKKKNITNTKKETETETETKTESQGKINTSKLESIPKIMASITRPTDNRGGSIYDLQLLHGVGPKSAIDLYEKGLTLEGLLKEWTDFINKNPKNALLLAQKMERPLEYSKSNWDSLEPWKKNSILDVTLKKKLETETKQLCKIHKSTLIGLKYFHDITQKIPREEITKAETILIRVAEHMNKDLKVMLCGSYRRGRDKSGDIDCCLFHPAIKTQDDIKSNKYNILANFVEMLINIDFIIDQLDMGLQKFMGLCMIKQNNKKQNVARRLDIRFMPYESYGSAILYFTGSANFNTDIRKIALSKGYSLSEFGFKKKSDTILIPCATEEDVFKFLNIPYKTPKERDI